MSQPIYTCPSCGAEHKIQNHIFVYYKDFEATKVNAVGCLKCDKHKHSHRDFWHHLGQHLSHHDKNFDYESPNTTK